jgi:hypothetical protein
MVVAGAAVELAELAETGATAAKVLIEVVEACLVEARGRVMAALLVTVGMGESEEREAREETLGALITAKKFNLM